LFREPITNGVCTATGLPVETKKITVKLLKTNILPGTQVTVKQKDFTSPCNIKVLMALKMTEVD